MKTLLRRFRLQRSEDVSGTSGTGIVAEGVQFANGMVALTWKSEYPCVNVYLSINVVENIHSHEGRTQVVWIDPDPHTKKVTRHSDGMISVRADRVDDGT